MTDIWPVYEPANHFVHGPFRHLMDSHSDVLHELTEHLASLQSNALQSCQYRRDFIKLKTTEGTTTYRRIRPPDSLGDLGDTNTRASAGYLNFYAVIFGTVGDDPRMFTESRRLTLTSGACYSNTLRAEFISQVLSLHESSESESLSEREDCYILSPPTLYVQIPVDCPVHIGDVDLEHSRGDEYLLRCGPCGTTMTALVGLVVDPYTQRRRLIAEWVQIWSAGQAHELK